MLSQTQDSALSAVSYWSLNTNETTKIEAKDNEKRGTDVTYGTQDGVTEWEGHLHLFF